MAAELKDLLKVVDVDLMELDDLRTLMKKFIVIVANKPDEEEVQAP